MGHKYNAHDGNGNMTARASTALELAYSDENQLRIVQSNTVVYGTNYPVWQTLYGYDGTGRLRLRVERQNMVMPDPGSGEEESFVGGGEESLEGGGGVSWTTYSITEYLYDG